MSTSTFLNPTMCGRRRLPKPPDASHMRRSSSPRILPTPPPLSPEYRCPSATPNMERRPSGRILPRPPTTETLMTTPPRQSSLSPTSLTPDPLPEFIVPEVDEFDEEVEEEQEMQPEPTVPESPIDQIGEFEDFSTGHEDQSSSHSPSIEQLTNKSTSDDAISHGLDPSLYSPEALNNNNNNNKDVPNACTSSTILLNPDDENAEPRGLGLLYCTMQHFPVRKRLRVSVLKIRGLAGDIKPEMEIHAIVKVNIPGLKGAKEQGSEMKRGREPVFNQEFFFDNVSHEELDTKSVLVSVYHQASAKISKDIHIGDATIPLRDIREMNTKKEIKIVEEVKPIIPKKLGKIYTSACIEKDSKRLTINLKKVDDLPKSGFTGAPDVCVKITLNQGERSQTKQSRVLKSTTTAVYNEAVMFLFNTTKNELAKTSVTISVHDMQRASSGTDVIGVAYLGVGAIDKSEHEQWKNCTEHMGKEYKGTHCLKPPATGPTVHVAEANDDGIDDEE